MLARAAWRHGESEAAINELRQALHGVERRRGGTSGGDVGRSAFLARFSPVFEDAVAWHAELNQLDQVAEAMERSRARSLLDHLDWYGANLLRGAGDNVGHEAYWVESRRRSERIAEMIGAGKIDPSRAAEHMFEDLNLVTHVENVRRDRKLFQEWYLASSVVRRRKLLELPRNGTLRDAADSTDPPDPQSPPTDLPSLERCVLELPDHDRARLFNFFYNEEIQVVDDVLRRQRQRKRGESEYWTEMADNWTPADMREIRQWSRDRTSFLLEYFVGKEASFLLFVEPDGAARVFPLVLDAVVAERLKVRSGPLTAELLQRWLLGSTGAVITRLSREQTAEDTLPDLALARLDPRRGIGFTPRREGKACGHRSRRSAVTASI